MNEVKKCPKCGSEMKPEDKIATYGYTAARIAKKWESTGDKIIPFTCSNCGYIELYNEKYLRK